jgi:hypothetical protein
MAQSTWAAADTTWASNPYTWSVTTYQATANMTQVNLTNVVDEDTVLPRGITLGGNYGMTGTTAHVMPATATLDSEGTITDSGLLKMPVSGIIAGTSNIKNNVNFEESGTMGMASSASSDNSFLWNDVVEDEDTLWTKISDPDN